MPVIRITTAQKRRKENKGTEKYGFYISLELN